MNSENVLTNVDKIRKHSQYQRDKHRVQNNTSPKGNQCCGYCGKMRHESRDHCPAKRSECSICKKVGHWAACCRQKQRIHTTNPTSAMDRILVLDVIGNKQRRRAPRINVDLHHKADDSFTSWAAIPTWQPLDGRAFPLDELVLRAADRRGWARDTRSLSSLQESPLGVQLQ